MDISSTSALVHAATETPATGPSRLSGRQMALVIGWGVLLWFVAALFIRQTASTALFARGPATALLFAAAWPIAWLAVRATRRLAALTAAQLVPGLALASAAAMLCDGIGITWTTLYGPRGADLAPPAAWLLWGVATILISAFASARSRGA